MLSDRVFLPIHGSLMTFAAARLTNREVADRFDAAAEQYEQISNPYTLERRATALAQNVRGRCLEVGGGTGAVIERLPNRSLAVHSDIAPGMCRVAARRLGCKTVCFDAESIPFADECADTVVSAEMIYYLRQPARFLAEAYRVLRPGGRLLLSTTNPTATFLERGRALLRGLGVRRMFFDDGSPSFPNLTVLTGMLEGAGFTVDDANYIAPLPFASLHWMNQWVERTPLRRLGLFVILSARKKNAAHTGL